MFLLDTNVLSELMRPDPGQPVADWVANQPLQALLPAAPCQAEIFAGIAILPDGRRRNQLAAAAHAMFADDFAARVLPFDADAATTYADPFAARRRAGWPTPTIDMMIAAIARIHGISVVTRNVADFNGCGVAVIKSLAVGMNGPRRKAFRDAPLPPRRWRRISRMR
jgi:predicted nucleic acid-binding protein